MTEPTEVDDLIGRLLNPITMVPSHEAADVLAAQQKEIVELKSNMQDMFDELHAFADNSNFVSLEDQQRWRDGEITIVELVAIGRESMV